jgi:hypothetical protein
MKKGCRAVSMLALKVKTLRQERKFQIQQKFRAKCSNPPYVSEDFAYSMSPCCFLPNFTFSDDQMAGDTRVVLIDEEPNHCQVLIGKALRVFDVSFSSGKRSLVKTEAANTKPTAV